MQKLTLLVLLVTAATAALTWHAAQASGSVQINEIMYDFVGADDKREWVELWNNSSAVVDLTGWKFYDGTNHVLNAPPANDGQGSLALAAGNYLVLADNAATFLADHPGFSGTVIDTVMSLNNTGETIKLLDKNEVAVSQLMYNKTMGANGNGKTLEVSASESLAPSYASGGTPGAANSVLSPPPPPPPPPPAIKNPSTKTAPAPAPPQQNGVPDSPRTQPVHASPSDETPVANPPKTEMGNHATTSIPPLVMGGGFAAFAGLAFFVLKRSMARNGV